MLATDDPVRVFRTAWFTKAARKARITDAELCSAIGQAILGQATNLGVGVFKKRLNKNLHRSILIVESGSHWIYVYLFAKKDRSNIDNDERDGFRKLAKIYATLTESQITELTRIGELVEICHGRDT